MDVLTRNFQSVSIAEFISCRENTAILQPRIYFAIAAGLQVGAARIGSQFLQPGSAIRISNDLDVNANEAHWGFNRIDPIARSGNSHKSD